MRIVVLGATGRTGRIAVDRALERGHEVLALVRSEPSPLLDGRALVMAVDLHDVDAVTTALDAADAVVSAIGPVAGVTRTEVSEATRTLVEAMARAGIRRVVVPANGTVFTDDPVSGEFANVAAEHRRDVEILRASGLDWTVVAAPVLTDDPPTGQVATVVDAQGPGPWLTRGDFAATLLDALEHDDWVGHLVGTSN